MNILICDNRNDEVIELEAVIKASGFGANIIHFNNGADVLSYIQSGSKVDVCFLDILMPEMNGTMIAAQMRNENFCGEIVFLTTSNEYAAESYRVDAFSYLLKPPDIESVSSLLHEVEEAKKVADTAGIPVVTRYMSKFLLFQEISCIEVIQHKVYFRLIDGNEIGVNTSLRKLLPKLLEDGRFARCHRSFVVNMNAVSFIQDNNIVLKCGRKIHISKSYLGFDKQYLSWVFGGVWNERKGDFGEKTVSLKSI